MLTTEQLKDKYDDALWTVFSLKGHEDFCNDLHITHKYLGHQTDETTKEIEKTIDSFFEGKLFSYSLSPFFKECAFRIPRYFDGENLDEKVRVLILDEQTYTSFHPGFLSGLHSILKKYKEDDYHSYVPHITTELPSKVTKVDRFILAENYKIIASWQPVEYWESYEREGRLDGHFIKFRNTKGISDAND